MNYSLKPVRIHFDERYTTLEEDGWRARLHLKGQCIIHTWKVKACFLTDVAEMLFGDIWCLSVPPTSAQLVILARPQSQSFSRCFTET